MASNPSFGASSEPHFPDNFFERVDNTPDEDFYETPRMVAHIEPQTIAAVTKLYREVLPPDGAILDLMSSWISHLPEETSYASVTGLGMSRDELAANPRLSHFVTRNLNRNPQLPFEKAAFDATVCCVSVQYLTRPVEVMREVARVCKSGAPFVITFSNRCFPSKAVRVWQMLDDYGHANLVSRYLEEAGDWEQIEVSDRTPQTSGEPLIAVVARRV